MLIELVRRVAANGLRAVAGALEPKANRFALDEPEADWGAAFGRYELSPRARAMVSPAPQAPKAEPAARALAGSAAARITAARGL